MKGCFVSATGTGVGKTAFSRGLTLALRGQGLPVAALKPIETGWSGPEGSDAQHLALASGCPSHTQWPGFYRAAPPLAPAAVALQRGGAACPSVADLAAAARAAAGDAEFCLVEGAGGLLVPLDETSTVADLAKALAVPLVLVAPNRLGVLSHVLTAAESAARRELPLAAVVLMDIDPGLDIGIEAVAGEDVSRGSNGSLLRTRLAAPVLEFPHVPMSGGVDEDAALRSAALECGVLPLLLG